jgi:O-antigen/teichoic acid export membrane protein
MIYIIRKFKETQNLKILVHSMKKFWDKNYAFAGGIKIIVALQFMVLAKLAALHLNLADAGIFFLMHNTAMLVCSLLFSVHSASLLRYYSSVEDKIILYKTVVWQLCFVISLLCLAGMGVFYFFPENTVYKVTLVYAVSSGSLLILTTKLRAASQFNQLFYFLVAQSIVLAILVTTATLFLDLSPWLMIGSVAISTFICLFYYLIRGKKTLWRIIQTKLDKDLAQSFLLYGMPFILVSVSNIVISTNGQFMLKLLGYDDEVGAYAANYNIGEKAVFLWLSLLVMVNVPKIYQAYESSGSLVAWLIIKRCMAMLSLCGAILFVLTFFWSRELSEVFASEEISRIGHWIIPATVVSAVLLGFCSFLAEPLLLVKKSGTVAICYISSAILSVGLGYFLISELGLLGAVINPIVTNTFFMILLVFNIRKSDVFN